MTHPFFKWSLMRQRRAAGQAPEETTPQVRRASRPSENVSNAVQDEVHQPFKWSHNIEPHEPHSTWPPSRHFIQVRISALVAAAQSPGGRRLATLVRFNVAPHPRSINAAQTLATLNSTKSHYHFLVNGRLWTPSFHVQDSRRAFRPRAPDRVETWSRAPSREGGKPIRTPPPSGSKDLATV